MDYSLRSPFGPSFGRSLRFALVRLSPRLFCVALLDQRRYCYTKPRFTALFEIPAMDDRVWTTKPA
jgi:hypothetical protein